MEFAIKKYPRTPHLQGSKLQPGDEDLSQVSFESIAGKHIVIEEKIDGANSAVSFDADGTLLLQSRGHYLIGGAREVHYDLFKQWAMAHRDTFYRVLGTRYIMYGEWMYAKHSMFYDALPSYFMEFDIFDREKEIYLDTLSRRELTSRMPISSVPVLAEGNFQHIEDVLKYLGKSNYVLDGHIKKLVDYCEQNGLNTIERLEETDRTDIMEGLYIKIEENGCVANRVKYVRAGFAQGAMTSPHHWLHKAIIPNMLSVPLSDIFEE